jgi:hypothetical protein
MMNDRSPIGIPSSEDKPTLGTYKHQYQVIGDRVHEIKNVVVHTFSMGDVEDPDLYAAEPLMKWQNSESGSWVMSHSVEQPMWHRHADPTSYGYKYAVTAKLLAKDYTYWSLKWGSFIDNKQF